MHNVMRIGSTWGARLLGVLAALLLLGGGAALAATLPATTGTLVGTTRSFDLWAVTGTTTLPGGAAVNVWGYADSAGGAVTQPGGPMLIANQGETVVVNLTNTLTEASAILFQGQTMVPDTTGAAAGIGTKSYTFTATSPGTFLYEAGLLPNAQHQAAMGLYGALIVRPPAVTFTGIAVARTDATAAVTNGSDSVTDAAILSTDVGSTVSGTGIPPGTTVVAVGTGTFTMSATATADGTGVVVTRTDTTATVTSGSSTVTDAAILSTDAGSAVSGTGIPSGTTITAATAGASFTMSVSAPAMPQAYGASTPFDDEAVVVLSEIDPALNNSATPATFDMRDYAPRYFLINGKAYPATDAIASAARNKVLLRYVNAGIQHHSMGVLGLRQIFVAKDASLLPTLNHNVVAESLAPGQTGDAIATIPAAATGASKFAVYDASLMLHNNGAPGFGGMLAFVTAGTGSGPMGPVTSAVALSPNPSNGLAAVTLAATITSGVTAAEYFVDGVGANGTGCAVTGSLTSVNVTIPVSGGTTPCASLATLASGKHTFYVHGTDGTTWGAVASAVLNLDKAGPVTSGLTLTPNPSNGTVSVALSATANDSANGGSNIAAAEYRIDGGTVVAMTVGGAPAPVASLTATIAAGLSVGTHTVAVRSQDALGNWGGSATVTLNVVAAGPATSAVSVAKNPNNGALPLNASQPVVRVTATMTSTGSTVSGAEGFIDTVGANGTGFQFNPSDGFFNAATETGYADIPLATINLLSAGNHTIYVHGKDAVGNWGTTSTTILVIDKAVPTVSGLALTPSVTNNAAVAVSAAASDAGTGNSNIVAGEYFIDAAGAAGAGAAMTAAAAAPSTTIGATIPGATIAALAAGNHTVYVRARDAAGNWSATTSATLLIDRTAPTFSGITLTPTSIPVGTASVGLTVNGATDPLVSGLASGVAGGEYWFGATNITAGTGTAFSGSAASIDTSALAVGTYTVRVRMRDAAGNWSTGANGVRTATLTVTLLSPTVGKAFAGSVRGGNGTQAQRTTTLTLTLSNSNAAAITGVALTDNLPQPAVGNFTVVTSATTCGGGTTSTPNVNRRLLLTGGTIPANGSCTVTATVRLSGGATNGPYTLTNTILAGGVTTTNAGSNLAPASAVLTVIP